MKKISLLLLTVSLCFACRKEEPVKNTEPMLIEQPGIHAPKILLLKVDYLSSTFECGKEIYLSQQTATGDSIPVLVNYDSPGDFGNIEIRYKTSNDLLFDGSIIWMGKGAMTFPAQLDSASLFNKTVSPLAQPLATRFQTIFYQGAQPLNVSALWNTINKLKIVKDYLPYNKKIGLFLYTPSVGIGDPADWDWFILLSN